MADWRSYAHNNHLTATQRIFLSLCAALALAGCESAGPHQQLTAQQQQGERVFNAACAIYHDPYSDSPRQGPGMRDLFRKKYLPSGAPANDERVREVIRRGRRNMPAFENAMDEKQLDDLIAFLHAL